MLKLPLGLILTLLCLPAKALSIFLESPSKEAVKGIAVYLIPADSQTQHKVAQLPPATKVTTITQKNKKFAPYLTISQSHQDVSFENLDDITHHIYSLNSERKFDFKLPKNDGKKTLHFNNEHKIAMGCNIHDWMAGHLLIVNTPLFAITNEQGRVAFNDIPNGTYLLAKFHPQMNEADQLYKLSISVPSSDITLQLQHEIQAIPDQQNIDEFDFIEAY